MDKLYSSLTTWFLGDIKPTHNYHKHCNDRDGEITGYALSIDSSQYAIIDVDIHENKEQIRKQFKDICKDLNVRVVRTGSGGLHIYTMWDESFKATKDSYVKAYKDPSNSFDIDVFVPFKSDKVSRCIVLPGSQVKKNNSDEILEYEHVKICLDAEMVRFEDMRRILQEKLNISLDLDQKHKQVHTIVDLDTDDSLIEPDLCDSSPMTKTMFDTIIEGFDEHITIHNDCGTDLKHEVSILPIVTALNACVSNTEDGVTRDDVEDALDLIHDRCVLTSNAESKWDQQLRRNRKTKAEHYGGLFTILKLYNPEYYDQHIKPLLKTKNTSTPEDFLNERYTISDFKRDKTKFTTYEDYVSNLVKCLAFVDDGRYIIKEKSKNRIKYNVIDSKKLNEILNFEGSYIVREEITQEDVDKAIRLHRKKPILGQVSEKSVKIKMMKLLRDNNVQSCFKRFVSVDLIGDNDEVFGLYRPPNPIDYYTDLEDEPELVDRFLTLINDQLFDENAKESFNHFLHTHAYLLQYHKKSNVFFVKYSSTGNTGKNYIDNAFSRLYEGFSLNGITEQQLTEKHNGGMIDKLYRSYDEFDNSNYQSKTINNIVKRLTNDKIAARAMCSDTKEQDDFAIDVLNTNDAGLYGMLKGGNALLSRLCIMRLKERDIKQSKYADDIDVIDEPNFGYSLYNYLINMDLSSFVRGKAFNRYPLDKTKIIIDQLAELRTTTLDEFIDSIYDEFEQKKYKGEQVDFITCDRMKSLYRDFTINNKYRFTTNLDNELEAKGIHKIKSMWVRGTSVSVYYRKHVDRKDDIVERFDDDEENDGFEDA